MNGIMKFVRKRISLLAIILMFVSTVLEAIGYFQLSSQLSGKGLLAIGLFGI